MKNEKDIQKVQSLLENKDFDQLSVSEKEIVENTMTEKAYTERRAAIVGAIALFSEANMHEPKPLIIPASSHFLLAPIPLYQVLVGIAAIALLMLLIIPLKKIEMPKNNVQYVTVYDTLEVVKTEYDTIETIIEKPIFKEKLVYVNQTDNMKPIEEEPRLFEVPRNSQYVSLSPETIQNKGISMKEDTMLISLPRVY